VLGCFSSCGVRGRTRGSGQGSSMPTDRLGNATKPADVASLVLVLESQASKDQNDWTDQRGQASLISMAHVASPSTASQHAEFDDEYEYRSGEHENRGTEQGGQKKSDEELGLRATTCLKAACPLGFVQVSPIRGCTGNQSFAALPEGARSLSGSGDQRWLAARKTKRERPAGPWQPPPA
jgi:hypothetical protein